LPLQAWLCGLALACLAGRAEAADARYRFTIGPRTYADALIELGVQANISVVGVAACGPGGRTQLAGRYTVPEALDRVLADAPCQYRIVDARTVRIVAAPPSAPAPPTPRAPAPPPSLVSELVVTATKRPVSLERLAAGVSVVSREQIATTGAVDVALTTGQIAGVLTTNLGPGRDKLLIRGLSDGAFTGRTRSTVSTYLDEAPLNYNAPDPDLRLADVERIEVVRGPQGALYGSGAISGIYRIVTRKPDVDALGAGITAGVATTKGGDTSSELEGFVNLPVAPGRAALRLTAYEDRQGGYLDDVNLRITNVDETRRDGGRLALRVKLGSDWRVDVLGATQHLRSNDTQYVTPTLPTMNRSQRANSIREAHNNDVTFAGLSVQGRIGAASLEASTGYIHHTFSSQYEANDALSIFSTPSSALGVYVESARIDIVVQDVVLRSSKPGRFSWLVGAYAASTLEHSPSTLGALSAAGAVATVYDERRKDRIGEIALYGEASYELGDGWSATVGGRQFDSRVRTSADISVAPPGESRSFARSRRFNGFLPKLSIQKAFGDGDLVYALLSEGYRPGGFNSGGFLSIRTLPRDRTTFAPDRLRNYELGAKLRGFDGRLTLRAAAYWDEWRNVQTDQYRPSGLAYTANVGDARIVGLEAELGYQWDFGLSLQLNGLLSDSDIRHPNPDFACNTAVCDGSQVTNNLPGVPKVSGGLLAIYQRSLGPSMTFRLIGEASYVGEAGVSFDARLPPRTGSYLRTRLAAEVATQVWRASVFVSNPFDEAGDTFAYGNPFSLFGDRQIQQSTPQRPRTLGVRLSAEF
jgi:outer membrane receptor protein involved in Fe transport